MVEDPAQEVNRETKQMQQSETHTPAFDIEDFIVGLFVLAKQAVVTLYDVAIHPARVSEEINHGGREKRYLRPFTFLVLVSFVFVSVIRNALIYKLIWERGETFISEGIDYSNLVLPWPELSEFLQLPSLGDIMLVGVPLILMVLVFSGLFGFLLSARSGRNYKHFMQIGCYAVGFQSFMFFIFISTTVGVFNAVNPSTFGSFITSPYLATIIVLLGVVWPGAIFSRMILSYIPVESRRINRKWFSWSVTLTGASLICLTTIVSSSALANRLAEFDCDERHEVKRLVHAAILPTSEGERAQNVLTVMITNNSNEHITIMAKDFKTTNLEGEKSTYEIGKSWPRDWPIISIAPNESICLKGSGKEFDEDPAINLESIVLDRILPDGERSEVKIKPMGETGES